MNQAQLTRHLAEEAAQKRQRLKEEAGSLLHYGTELKPADRRFLQDILHEPVDAEPVTTFSDRFREVEVPPERMARFFGEGDGRSRFFEDSEASEPRPARDRFFGDVEPLKPEATVYSTEFQEQAGAQPDEADFARFFGGAQTGARIQEQEPALSAADEARFFGT